jgi:hypothetical protein
VIVPDVGSAQVGSVADAVAVGAVAGGLTVTLVVAGQVPETLLSTLTVYDPAPTPGNVGDDWNVVPSMEYVYCAPRGDVTVIEPAAGSAHVGSVELAVGII